MLGPVHDGSLTLNKHKNNISGLLGRPCTKFGYSCTTSYEYSTIQCVQCSVQCLRTRVGWQTVSTMCMCGTCVVSQQTRRIYPMFDQCWADVVDMCVVCVCVVSTPLTPLYLPFWTQNTEHSISIYITLYTSPPPPPPDSPAYQNTSSHQSY